MDKALEEALETVNAQSKRPGENHAASQLRCYPIEVAMEKLKIIDMIRHRNKYGHQQFVVLNRSPQFLYERKGIWLIGEDSGFFNFYKYDIPSGRFYAFAGRKFDIPMKDGSIEKAYGQWWDGTPKDYQGLVYELDYGTPEKLAECNVFCHVRVDCLIIDKWLATNHQSNNYHKYDKRHADFGKQIIESQWVTSS